MIEVNFDGLVGPTHNYGGLSPGNVASATHAGEASHPKQAALQGLSKMAFVRALGVPQAVLPPHERPSLRALHALGFRGSDEELIAQSFRSHEQLVRLCSSAAAMWTANACTVAPSSDTQDGRLHLVPANLQAMFHRSLEAPTTHAVLQAIFADPAHFAVHAPLPGGGQFADEGAANHTRLQVGDGPAAHLFAWGRTVWGEASAPKRHPARQTREASEALVRLLRVDPARALLPQQHPDGIDAGAFHTDVLAVGHRDVLLLHELAFVRHAAVIEQLRGLLGDGLQVVVATEKELPASEAVAAYPFNSQLLTRADGELVLVAPDDCREVPRVREFLHRVIAEPNRVREVHFLDVRQSMHNGGGPACLRQRIPMTTAERAAVKANVFLDEALEGKLRSFVERHYRDELAPVDLGDPALARESMAALDELTGLLGLGPVYDFQR